MSFNTGTSQTGLEILLLEWVGKPEISSRHQIYRQGENVKNLSLTQYGERKICFQQNQEVHAYTPTRMLNAFPNFELKGADAMLNAG